MTEESIDTERMMLGIDDAGNHSINWIRCADRMPPDDERIIIHEINEDIYFDRSIHGIWSNFIMSIFDCEWIPHDEATWKELSK